MPDSLQSWFGSISDQDIDWVCKAMGLPSKAFSGINGNDARLDVLRSLETLDIEACPGSGKTTLLVAKLAILGSRWKPRQQGVCVLSHTNAARNEIGERLSSTNAGNLLLRYPHFVGTIHSFINEFLALPWLRSKGLKIRAIDDSLAQKDRWWRLPANTRWLLEQRHEKPRLFYKNTDFSGNNEPEHTQTCQHIRDACKASTEDGYYRFDEMFVWASDLIDQHPESIKTIRNRFPFVLVDEVQDNSDLQSRLLQKIFISGENPVIRQRFGDSNQAIYHRLGATGSTADQFPGPNKVDLPNSFRFGSTIAALATPLGLRPQALIGRGPTSSRVKHTTIPPVIFLFDDQRVTEVLPAYGKYLIDSFPAEVLLTGDFTAAAGVHRAEKSDNLPRFMGHYVPDYDPEVASQQPKPSTFTQYIARARADLLISKNTAPIANRWAEGVLQLLRLAGSDVPTILRKSAHRYLLELLDSHELRQQHLTNVERLIACRAEVSADDWNDNFVPPLKDFALKVLGDTVLCQDAQDFLVWKASLGSTASIEVKRNQSNTFQYPSSDPKVSIRLGSIHSMKGETHTATLVLESFQRTHHLKKLIPWIVGTKPKNGTDNTGEEAALIERLKLHYVAMTRPSHLLCLAMRKDSFTAKQLGLAVTRGWTIVDLCSSAPVQAPQVLSP
jgi:DNA helicase-2/ATP-dependent DNA helicase PcrA